MEKKKNNKHFIIPPSYFKARGIKPIPVQIPQIEQSVGEKSIKKDKELAVKEISNSVVAKPVIPKISIKKPANITSGLSLKSIKEKKEHQIKQLDVIIDEDLLPKEPVNQEDLIKAWNEYTESLHRKGEKILASIFEMEVPELKDTAICLTYSNNTNKIELERSQYPLMAYLKKTLKNYDLYLDISVNDEIAKKYAFTPQEKYEKLKEKNPNIEVLRKTFGLDI